MKRNEMKKDKIF